MYIAAILPRRRRLSRSFFRHDVGLYRSHRLVDELERLARRRRRQAEDGLGRIILPNVFDLVSVGSTVGVLRFRQFARRQDDVVLEFLRLLGHADRHAVEPHSKSNTA